MMHEIMKKLMKEHNGDTEFEVVTQKIRNLLMNGTTSLSLSLTGENERLLLILTGCWSGGALDPANAYLNGISFSACQHFQISNDKGNVLINRVHDLCTPPRRNKVLKVLKSKVEFRMKAWSF